MSAIPCGWGCGFKGEVPKVAEHLRDTHGVKHSVNQLIATLMESQTRAETKPVGKVHKVMATATKTTKTPAPSGQKVVLTEGEFEDNRGNKHPMLQIKESVDDERPRFQAGFGKWAAILDVFDTPGAIDIVRAYVARKKS